MTTYRRRPLEVQAVRFLKAGDHPLVESNWVVKRPLGHSGTIFDLYEGDPFTSPMCSSSTPGAVEMHILQVAHQPNTVTPGDWIVTERGETRVVPDAEFQRDYEASVSFCGGGPVIEYATEKLDWSGAK
jgi:hypothetical protein